MVNWSRVYISFSKYSPVSSSSLLSFTSIKSSSSGVRPFVVGVVYIPPENTSYSSPGSFIQIENEYLDISRNYNCMALLGDFNGRTPDDDDFILVNERSEEDDTGEYLENEIYTLDQLTIPRLV
jgi:hypothetical protein